MERRWIRGHAKFFNVRDYGAVGDGKTLDSPAIDKAIAAASDAGGGTVLVPAGTYLSGSIHLKSNIHLLLDAGSVILGAPQESNAYDGLARNRAEGSAIAPRRTARSAIARASRWSRLMAA